MGFAALGVQKSFNSDADVSQLTLENVEALAGGEGGNGGSITTWRCKGPSTRCHAKCGVCGTEVNDGKRLVGRHRCWGI